MAARVGGPGKGIRAEINVTPLVDVVLVLLIIFMVVTPLLQRGKDVRLPEVRRADGEKKEGDPLVLSLTADRKIYLEEQVLDEAGLATHLQRRLAAEPHRQILLKGDARLPYGEVRRVMEVARQAGAGAIRLGVREARDR
jgi:biopolymer transport protein ExbD